MPTAMFTMATESTAARIGIALRIRQLCNAVNTNRIGSTTTRWPGRSTSLSTSSSTSLLSHVVIRSPRSTTLVQFQAAAMVTAQKTTKAIHVSWGRRRKASRSRGSTSSSSVTSNVTECLHPTKGRGLVSPTALALSLVGQEPHR